ncbi:c-type cytochrome [Noviherbaspirillum humi]|nr:c-type cytochrome [Noviherbaspirillum humi]
MIARMLRRPLPALLAALAMAGPALAGPQEGAAKAQACAACHGPEGNSTNPAIPSLSAQPKQFIVSALYQFREGKRKNEQMTPMAAGLSNADMNDLAAYFAMQKAPAPQHKTKPENIDPGKRLTAQHNCIACHAGNLMGQQHIPRIAGQHEAYLREQLRGFKASTRAEMDGVMTSAAQALSEKDIEVLADYLAGLPAAN